MKSTSHLSTGCQRVPNPDDQNAISTGIMSWPSHLQDPRWQGNLRRVAHIAAAGMEAHDGLDLEPHALGGLKQCTVPAPVVLPRIPLHCSPLYNPNSRPCPSIDVRHLNQDGLVVKRTSGHRP